MRMPVSISKLTIGALLLFALVVVGLPATRAADFPKTTYDGLQLVENTKLRAVYVRPGASLKTYQHVMILDTSVAFKKNWQRLSKWCRTELMSTGSPLSA